jgi:flavin-dependent dehydrogenase
MAYDVIIVGARCAGASTAMLLARRGYRVLMVDRARFPSEISQGHFIHRDGPRRLRDWGLLDAVIGSGCPPATSITMDFDGTRLTARDLVVDGVAAGYGPRRRTVDQILIDAAVRAGAELRQEFTVTGFTFDGERVTGIEGHGESGRTVAEQGTITVGAEGRMSRLARAVAAPEYDCVPALLVYYFTYFEGAQDNGMEVFVRGRRAIFAHPTNDDLLTVFVAFPAEEQQRVLENVDQHFRSSLALVPEFAQRLRDTRRVERYLGAGGLSNFKRRPHGPGWALVGDAGSHKDPFMALGMSDALRDAEFLAEAIDAGLSGRMPLEAAMEEREQRRNEAMSLDWSGNLAAASFAPAPEQLRLMRALVEDEAGTRQFFLAREGMIPRAAFFNPDNLARITSRIAMYAQ